MDVSGRYDGQAARQRMSTAAVAVANAMRSAMSIQEMMTYVYQKYYDGYSVEDE